MKIGKLIQILLFMLIFNFTNTRAQNWIFDKSPTRQNLARLDMLSDSVGWAVSYDGLILNYTGNKWTVFDSLRAKYSKIYSKIDTMGVLGTFTGDIYTIRVPDHKYAWMALNNNKHKIFLVLKYDLQTKEIVTYKLPLKVRSLDFINSDFGIAVGEGGAFIYRNGRWSIGKLPISVDFKMVHFVDSKKIIICGDRGTLIEGDGENWRIIQTNVRTALRDFYFISPDEGWIVGYNGTILHYKNGKVSQEISESIENIWSVHMLSESAGYAVGENGTLLKYNGEFWDKIDLKTDVDLHDMEMINENLAYAVGARGSILKYAQDSNISRKQHFFLFSDQVHLGSSYLMDRIDDVHGVTFAYFNADNKIDAYMTCTRSLNHLIINQGQGYYEDFVIESRTGGNIETRIGKLKYEYGTLAADFDRDNDTDFLLAGKRKTSRYFINDGKAVFDDGTKFSGLPNNLNIIDGGIGDLNEDGYPDLALADVEKGLRLIINKKYNRFNENVWSDDIQLPTFGIRATKIADFNGDGHQDIIVVYQQHAPVILLNDGNAHWESVPLNHNQNNDYRYINSISVADINCDGYNDIYLCTEDGRDKLLVYDAASKQFINQAAQWGVKSGGRSYSAIPADYDMNGTVDIFVSRYGPDFLYLNQNNNKFIETAKELVYSKSGFLDGFNTGAATADIDHNHSPDLIVGNNDYWSSILQNQKIRSSKYLSVEVIGVNDTREALGAKIWIWKADGEKNKQNLLQFREVVLNQGLFSQSSPKMYFYFPESKNVDIKIKFLNDTEIVFDNVSLNQNLKVYQERYLTRKTRHYSRALMRFLHIPQMLTELLKFVFFIGFIIVSVRFIEKRYKWRTTHTVAYVLAVIPIYAIVNYVFKETGGFYHVFPFVLLVFTMAVVIAVNEPILEISRIENYRQQRTNQAVINLSKTTIVKEAFEIVKNTIDIIKPYKRILFYSYMKSGNYFFCDLYEGLRRDEKPNRVMLKRENIEMLKTRQSFFYFDDIKDIWPDAEYLNRDTLFFPLIRKNRLHGMVILVIDGKNNDITEPELKTVQYLMLQFAIALDNIKIIQDLNEQEKLGILGTFASGIIHNLKNPIDGLRMMIEMLDQEIGKDDERKEYVTEIHAGITQLKQRLMHSFDFLKYDNPLKDKVDINKVLSQILTDYDSNNNLSPFKWRRTNEKVYVQGDFLQLKNAIENVIQNAVEASCLKHKIIIISSVNKESNFVEVIVRDNGHGIQDEHLGKIFDMFYSTRGKDRGLGLALTKIIIKNHKGYMEVKSKQGIGTEFKIALPIND